METQANRNRKFKAFLLVFFTTTALLVFHRLTNEQYIDALKWIFGPYILGNLGERALKAIKRQDKDYD